VTDLEPGTEVTATVRGVVEINAHDVPYLRIPTGGGFYVVVRLSTLSDVRPVERAELPALRNAEHFVRVPAYEMAQGTECACGLDVLDPIHLRHNGRNEGRQPWLSSVEQDRVNARRREYGMAEITRTGTRAVCP
jgi:hypothetical protein